MTPTTISGAKQRRRCNEPACLTRALQADAARVRQLQPGRLEVTADCVVESRLHVVTVRFSRNVRIAMDRETSFLVVPSDRARSLRVEGAEIGRNDAVLCGRSTRGNGAELVLAGGSAVLFIELREQAPHSNVTNDAAGPMIVPNVGSTIRALAHELFDRADGDRRPPAKAEGVARTLRLIARSGRDAPPSSALPLKESPQAVGLIGALVRDFFQTSDYPSVEQMCRLTGYSRRSLTYAFQRRYGVPPKRFFRNLALNEVRQALLNSRGEAKVSAVAPFFGFSHMGQFSADYRHFFGELPSHTLERSRAGAEKRNRFDRMPGTSAIRPAV